MTFEDIEAAWQKENSMNRSFGRVTPQVAAAIRQRAHINALKQRRGDIAGIACALLLLGLLTVWLSLQGTTLAQAGVALVIAGALIEVLSLAALRSREEGMRLELSARQFLLRERARLESRARLMRNMARWYAVPAAAGLILWLASTGATVTDLVKFSVAVLSAGVVIHWRQNLRIRRELEPLLSDIDHELEGFETI